MLLFFTVSWNPSSDEIALLQSDQKIEIVAIKDMQVSKVRTLPELQSDSPPIGTQIEHHAHRHSKSKSAFFTSHREHVR